MLHSSDARIADVTVFPPISQLRTAAMLMPRITRKKNFSVPDNLDSLLRAKGFQDVVNATTPPTGKKWRKIISSSNGERITLQVIHNPNSSAFTRVASGETVPVFWFAYVFNPPNRQERPDDRGQHVHLIHDSFGELFRVPSTNHAYCIPERGSR